MQIGPIIKAARERKGLTQFELAERVGISRPMVSAWEKGRRIPLVPDQTDALARVLDIPLEQLLEAVGVKLYPSREARGLPRDLIEGLLELGPQQLATVHELVRFLNTASARDGASDRRQPVSPGGR